jgi:hypothetical protein
MMVWADLGESETPCPKYSEPKGWRRDSSKCKVLNANPSTKIKKKMDRDLKNVLEGYTNDQ